MSRLDTDQCSAIVEVVCKYFESLRVVIAKYKISMCVSVSVPSFMSYGWKQRDKRPEMRGGGGQPHFCQCQCCLK